MGDPCEDLPDEAAKTFILTEAGGPSSWTRTRLMCHFVPDDEHLFKGDDVGIWSDDPAIVSDMGRTMAQQWAQAGA